MAHRSGFWGFYPEDLSVEAHGRLVRRETLRRDLAEWLTDATSMLEGHPLSHPLVTSAVAPVGTALHARTVVAGDLVWSVAASSRPLVDTAEDVAAMLGLVAR